MLPKINQPTFDLVIPSSGRKIRYRPFTVREEKILLIAQSSEEQSAYINAFKQIITNCVVDDIDVDQLASYDIEYLFLNLRSKSVSNVVELNVKDEYDAEIKVSVNLDNVAVHAPTVSKNIVLDEARDIGVRMKYPTFGELEGLTKRVNGEFGMAQAVELLVSLIDCVWEGENVTPASSVSQEELREFVSDFNGEQVKSMEAFLNDLPYVYLDINYVDSKGDKKTRRITGISSFFG